MKLEKKYGVAVGDYVISRDNNSRWLVTDIISDVRGLNYWAVPASLQYEETKTFPFKIIDIIPEKYVILNKFNDELKEMLKE